MRIVRPYGESVAPGAGSERLLRPKKQLRDQIGDADRRIPTFAAGHDELVIAQWISTIDKIATKPKGNKEPTPRQRALREKLGKAGWDRLVDQKLLPGLPKDQDDYLGKLWWFKIHPYPKGTKAPKVVNGREIPDPRGRWYSRFVCDVAPDDIDAATVAARVHEHLHVAEYRHGTEQKHDKGRIERRARSIAKNTASLAQVTKERPTWTEDDVATYAQTAGDVATAIKQAAEAREADNRRVGADVAAEVLYPAFGKLFPNKGIKELENQSGLPALHLAIRDFYQRRLKRHKKDQPEHKMARRKVSTLLPADMAGLAAMLRHTAANRDVAALVRLGKVIHYEAAFAAGQKAADGDAPAHVLEKWPAEVKASHYWSSEGQAEIKRNEAFVRIWRHSLALAAQTLRDWASPDGSFHTDILSEKQFETLTKNLDLDHHARKLAVLLGNRAEFFLKGRGDAFQKQTLKLALQGLTQLRHNSFHFNGRGGFADALKFTRKPEITADQHMWDALGALWATDLEERGKRLIDTLEAAHLHHFFDWEHNKRLIGAVARAKLAEGAEDLPLPRFRRLLDRAANIRGKDGINLRLPKPVNRQDMEDFPALHAKYVALKLLYENPFRQWVGHRDRRDLVNKLIDRAVRRADKAAKDLHGKADADRRLIITAKAKGLGRLGEGEKLHDFAFRLSRETASEMRVQRGYDSDGERAREQAAFIEELLIDVLAQAFDHYLRKKKFDFLVDLRADEPRPKEPKCALRRPVLDAEGAAAPQWQVLLYFLLHLIPVDDIGRLVHQIRKWDITAGKAAGTTRAADDDVDRVARTLTLYLDMHDAKFTGDQALQALAPLHELYASKETFERFFLRKATDDNEYLPRRGLREILRFGHLPPLRAIFAAHKVDDDTVQKVEAAEKGPLVAAQRERERLHKLWVDQRRKLGAEDLRCYVDTLAEVTRHRHAAAHVRLVDHVELHRLMLAVLGRLLDFAGLFERDLYFAMLALIYRAPSSPQAVLDEADRELLRRGQIVETWRKLQDSTFKDELAQLFDPTSGRVIRVRNDFAHFNMLNPRRSRGATIDLTARSTPPAD